MKTFEGQIAFHGEDMPRTIFPLETNHYLISQGADQISDYIYNKIGLGNSVDASFLPQERVYASKHGHDLRRTQKLDPVSEFFIYDIVYRHREKFRGDFNETRRNFGYRFLTGAPISSSDSYRDFKKSIIDASGIYSHYCRFDIASYFNSIYHHDLLDSFSDIFAVDSDSQLFGKFLRQINSGRSIDCLTQGIFPTKILGSYFLKFVDNSPRIKCPLLLRFMDDFYLFSNEENLLRDDYIVIQKILGEKGLSVNPSKTIFGESAPAFIDKNVDSMRLNLLTRKRHIYRSYDELEEDVEENSILLSSDEINYLFSLLQSKNMDEEDAELVLVLMRERGDDLIEYLDQILVRFPYLARNLALFCDHITDTSGLADLFLNFLEKHDIIAEFQLFWITRITEKMLLGEPKAGTLITRLYEHSSATKISRAKILEIPNKKYGLPELRSEQLRSGSSDWLSWSSAVGCRNDAISTRNHSLTYFANGSHINRLIASIIKKMKSN
jgi:hypothetical protein